MVDTSAQGVVISVNGQVPDGEDLLVVGRQLRAFRPHTGGRRGRTGTDLAVRLGYADVPHTLVHNTIDAITSCPTGHVEVVAGTTPRSCRSPELWGGCDEFHRADRTGTCPT